VTCSFNSSRFGLPPSSSSAAGASAHQNEHDLRAFCVFDGHNGPDCAVFLANNFESALGAALRAAVASVNANSKARTDDTDRRSELIELALTRTFLDLDGVYCNSHAKGGSTATVVLMDGWRVYTANVGDSLACLDVGVNAVTQLTYNFRVDISRNEQLRLVKAGATIARLQNRDGDPVGPLRVWPGGLCLSRAIGDNDVGLAILSKPHVGMVDLMQLNDGAALKRGCRVVLGSDGHWETQGYLGTATKSRGFPAQAAADRLVAQNIQTYGIQDDITLCVVDMLPPESRLDAPLLTMKKSSSTGCVSGLFGWGRGGRVTAVNRINEISETPDMFLNLCQRSDVSSALGAPSPFTLEMESEDAAFIRRTNRNSSHLSLEDLEESGSERPSRRETPTMSPVASFHSLSSAASDDHKQAPLASPETLQPTYFVTAGEPDPSLPPSHEGTHHLGGVNLYLEARRSMELGIRPKVLNHDHSVPPGASLVE